jgi:hypothetical protein
MTDFFDSLDINSAVIPARPGFSDACPLPPARWRWKNLFVSISSLSLSLSLSLSRVSANREEGRGLYYSFAFVI